MEGSLGGLLGLPLLILWDRSVPLEEEFIAYISQEKEECHAGPQGKCQVLVRRQKQE